MTDNTQSVAPGTVSHANKRKPRPYTARRMTAPFQLFHDQWAVYSAGTQFAVVWRDPSEGTFAGSLCYVRGDQHIAAEPTLQAAALALLARWERPTRQDRRNAHARG